MPSSRTEMEGGLEPARPGLVALPARGPASWFGGELTAIAYCAPDKEAKVKTVSASVPVLPNTFAEATTPACPSGTTLPVCPDWRISLKT